MRSSPRYQTLRMCAALLLGAASAIAQTTAVYDSAGFEGPRFPLNQPLDGQDAPPAGQGPWTQDNGTSTAVVAGTNPVEGAQSVKVTRAATATANTRWGVTKAVAPGVLELVEVRFDMRVTYRAGDYGPLFGVEAYDASVGGPKLIGSLFQDAVTGELFYQQAGTAAYRGTGTFLRRNVHHHYRLRIDYLEKTCALYANDVLIHTEGFVNATATAFTDAPIATIAVGSPSETGIAYFDNYAIDATTKRHPHRIWRGNGASNVWDVGTSPHWFDGVGAVAFANDDPVVLDDTGSAAPAISVQGTPLPASMTVSGAQNYQLAGPGSIGGSGGLLKQGSGTLTIAGGHTFTGNTVVSGGTLLVNNSTGSGTGTGAVSIAPASSLGGQGRIAGAVTIPAGGVLAPGDGVGTLTIESGLHLTGAVLKMQLGSTSDRVAVGGDLRLSGGLEVIAAAGFGPGTYTLLTYGGALTAESFIISSAPAGYEYTLSTATPGSILLIVANPPPPPAAPAALTATTTGTTSVDLAWSDQSSNEAGFAIERSSNGGTVFTEIARVAANVGQFSNSGLTSGSSYSYRVRAFNGGGVSPYSNTASASTDSAPPAALYEFELNTLDTSGNNQHGAAVGAVTYVPGKVGTYAAAFGGQGFMEIPRVVTNDFTVSMWIKTSSTGAGGQWYQGMGLVDGEQVGAAADWGCSVLDAKFAFGVGAPDTTIRSNGSVNDGRWRHLAATRNSTTGEVRLYLDGVLDKVANTPPGPRTAPNELRVGASRTNVPVFFVGQMDQLAFHGKVLSAAEVAALAGPAGPPPPPAGSPRQIHPLGDSITWGYTTASAADSPGGYREPLYRNLALNNFTNFNFVGANTTNPGPLLTQNNQTRHDGYPQYTLTEISNNLDANAPTGKARGNNGGFWLTGTGGRIALQPEFILLLVGTNDIEGGATAPVIETRLSAMLTKIFTLRPATKVFLASIPPYPADAAKTATAKAYNQLMVSKTIPQFLDQGRDIRFVDQYANFRVSESPTGDIINSGLYGDTIHPNESGYQLMGDTWAAALLADPQPLPATPSGAAASAPAVGETVLTWQDNSDTEGAFLIERSLDGVSYQRIGFVGAGLTSFRDTAVAGATTYHYRVAARNYVGDSTYSNVATVTTLVPPPPAAPTGLTAHAGHGLVSLAWQASAGAASYRVKRATGSGGPFTLIGSPTATQLTDATAQNGTTYFYVVTAVNQNGESIASTVASARPEAMRALVWDGAADNRWTDFQQSNWRDGGGAAFRFSNGDEVTFDDTGENARAISIVGTVAPSLLTVAAAQDYRIGGNGGIGGAGSLVKSGTGMLTLSGHHTYTGATVIQDGTVRLSALAHRWSFNGNLEDSAGGRTATLVDEGAQNAVLSPVAVTLTGGARDDADYVDLGTNLLPGAAHPITVELWATQNAAKNFARIFDFGSSFEENLFMGWTVGTAPATDRVEWRDTAEVKTVDNSNQPYQPGVEFHIVMVIEPGVGTGGRTRVTWYSAPSAGALLGTARGSFETTNTLAALNDLNCWLGRSAWPGDETAAATYNEVRVWHRAMSSADLQSLHAAGADSDPEAVALSAGTSAIPALPVLPAMTALQLAGPGARLEIATGASQPVGSLSGVAGSVINLVAGSLTAGGDQVSTSFAGNIGGAGGLTKIGSGTLRLAGANSYVGTTTIAGGALLVNGSSAAAAGAISVRPSATLGGRGTVGGPVTWLAGSGLAPGDAVGTFTSGPAAWGGGVRYFWEVNDADAGAGIGSDLLSINGTLAIEASTAAPIVIDLTSLLPGGAAGPVHDFVGTSTYSWKLVATTGGITGFAVEKFVLDAARFAHPGDFALSVENSGRDLHLTYTPAGLNAWLAGKFTAAELADPAIGGVLGDADRDGLRNLEEYAYGGDPKLASWVELPVVETRDGYLAVRFTRLKDRTDIHYRVQATPDLQNYMVTASSTYGGAPVALNGGEVTTVPDGADPNKEQVVARDAIPISSAAKRFLRVVIVQP